MDTQNNTSPSPSKKEDEILEALTRWIEIQRPVLQVLLDAYCVVDKSNRVIDCNTAFEELCGESYRKIRKVGDFCTILHTEMCPDYCPAKQITLTERPLRVDELPGKSKGYPRMFMILSGVPITTLEHGTIGSLITIRNVSAESDLQRKYDERKKESITDGLTKLFNKMHTENTLLRLVKGSLREDRGLSVLMCDIDHFKKVNDTYGHQAGDAVLTAVATCLQQSARETDIVGRFGGEEFVAVLTNTDQAGTKIFAERFRKKVEAMRTEVDGKVIPVTVSLGTATFYRQKWQPGMDAANDQKELVHHADLSLYYSKKTGRNRLTQWEDIKNQNIEKVDQIKKAA